MHSNDDREPRTSVWSAHSVHHHKASEYVSALTCGVTNGRLINREKELGRGPGRRRGVTTSDFFGRMNTLNPSPQLVAVLHAALISQLGHSLISYFPLPRYTLWVCTLGANLSPPR